MSKRVKKIGLVVAAAIAAAGTLALVAVYAGAPKFDEDFYKAGERFKDKPYSDAPYAEVLAAHVDADGMVDYSSLKADRRRLDEYAWAVGWLDRGVYQSWDDKAKIAFWLNAYNALTLKLIVDHYPIAGQGFGPANSIKGIPNRWDAQFIQALREPKMSLNDIEHRTLRDEFGEPRIHMAMVCAAMGCPPLRNEPYTAEKLDEQLDAQTRRFLANAGKFKIDAEAGKVYLSPIFKWFGADFVKAYTPAEGFSGHGEALRASLNFISRYVPAEQAEYLRDRSYKVSFLDYDWLLNEQAKAAG